MMIPKEELKKLSPLMEEIRRHATFLRKKIFYRGVIAHHYKEKSKEEVDLMAEQMAMSMKTEEEEMADAWDLLLAMTNEEEALMKSWEEEGYPAEIEEVLKNPPAQMPRERDSRLPVEFSVQIVRSGLFMASMYLEGTANRLLLTREYMKKKMDLDSNSKDPSALILSTQQ
jgi:hypothetical protein